MHLINTKTKKGNSSHFIPSSSSIPLISTHTLSLSLVIQLRMIIKNHDMPAKKGEKKRKSEKTSQKDR